MQVLELFSGSESFSKVMRAAGHKCFTVELDPKFNPDLVIDVLDLELNQLPGNINFIWASPPCVAFSVLQIGKNWYKDHRPKTEKAVLGLKLLDKTIELISLINPDYWIIENPRAKMRKVIDRKFSKYGIMDYWRHTITYCQYGKSRMKPTDFWTNIKSWIPKPACKNGDPCHERAPRGSHKSGTLKLKSAALRSAIPKELCQEIQKAIDKQQSIISNPLFLDR